MTKKPSSLLAGYESDDLEPIIFNVPTIYNDKVKVHDWQMQTLAEPRDNAEIFPPKGHLHLASYRRLGPHDEIMWTTETKSMLEQIQLKQQYEPVYAQRSILNMHSFAMIEQDEKEEDLHLPEILLDPGEAQRMDYRTTMEINYRLPHPLKPKPPPPPPPPEPWLINRRTVGWSLCELEKRAGQNTFLDDNMDVHRRIAQLKSQRNQTNELLLNLDASTYNDNVPSKENPKKQEAQEEREETACS